MKNYNHHLNKNLLPYSFLFNYQTMYSILLKQVSTQFDTLSASMHWGTISFFVDIITLTVSCMLTLLSCMLTQYFACQFILHVADRIMPPYVLVKLRRIFCNETQKNKEY